MISYRPFRNPDPPQLVRLWHECELGRGAAAGFSYDALESTVFAQPYFDPHGFIVACDGPDIVGFVHAGFGADRDGSGVSRDSGVICAVIVHPQYRRQGIGRELIARAEDYLRSAGAAEIYAGPAAPRDPFYIGLYGGSRASGFLLSDPAADPFFQAVGYEPFERHGVFQRDLEHGRDPMNVRLMGIRRRTELVLTDHPSDASWWWMARFGRLDSLHFLLVPKGGSEPLAGVTAVGLDLYVQKWQTRAVGLVDLLTHEPERRRGYGQALIVEVCRRLRKELVNLVEAHARERNTAAVALLESAGFGRADTGVVYRRAGD